MSSSSIRVLLSATNSGTSLFSLPNSLPQPSDLVDEEETQAAAPAILPSGVSASHSESLPPTWEQEPQGTKLSLGHDHTYRSAWKLLSDAAGAGASVLLDQLGISK